MERYLHSMDPDFAGVDRVARKVCLLQYQDGWKEMDVEGTLYLCKRSSSRHHRIFLPNRRKIQNFHVDITEKTRIDYHNQFIILDPSGHAEYLGLWFESGKDALAIYNGLCGTGPGRAA